jgi:hypothetical protein
MRGHLDSNIQDNQGIRKWFFIANRAHGDDIKGYLISDWKKKRDEKDYDSFKLKLVMP